MNAQTGNTNPKKRFGNAKPPMHLIPPVAAIEEAVVMGLGAAKYGAYNWLENHVDASTYIAAIERHLKSWQTGEDRDPESGASHLAHIRCCCAILMDSQAAGILVDDRPKGAASAAEAIKRLTKDAEIALEVAGVMDDAGVDGAARDAVEGVGVMEVARPTLRLGDKIRCTCSDCKRYRQNNPIEGRIETFLTSKLLRLDDGRHVHVDCAEIIA